jgi:hypothetical protein
MRAMSDQELRETSGGMMNEWIWVGIGILVTDFLDGFVAGIRSGGLPDRPGHN